MTIFSRNENLLQSVAEENIKAQEGAKEMQTRRQMVKTIGAGALANVAAGFSRGQTVSRKATASTKMPRLFAGCCAYTFRKELLAGTLTLEDFIRKAVEFQLDAIDVTAYYLKSISPEYLENLRFLAYKNAVMFSGAACGVSMVQADESKRSEVLTEIKKWVDVTDRLGASHLRVFAGPLPKGITLEQAIGWTVETMKEATDYSGQKGITLGIEDHQGVSQSADVCLEIMHRVNSPYAGINIDITHFTPTPGQDAYEQIAACIPYATNTHIRNRFDDRSPIDMDRVWKLFADAGFKGYMSYEGDDVTTAGLPPTIVEIQRLSRKYSTV